MLQERRDALVAALADPPVWDKRVLEVGLDWPDLDEGQARSASLLRVVLLTWDPFEWEPDRPAAVATTTRRPDGFGLVLYLPLWQALSLAEQDPEGIAGVLGRFGESVVNVAAEHEGAIASGEYAKAAHDGRLPGLLSRVAGQATLPTPAISVAGTGWEELQYVHLEDLAQAAYGPADLDRSKVEFRAAGDHRPGCPGCAGQTVSFPDGIKEAQATICSAHRAEALKVTTARLEQAKASNPGGWDALLAAGNRLGEAHLPNGLGPKLAAAASVADPGPSQLRDQAALVVEAGALIAVLPGPGPALGAQLAPLRSWLEGLPGTLFARGMLQEGNAAVAAVAQLLTLVQAGGSVEEPGAATATAASHEDEPEAVVPKPEPFRRGARIGRNAPCPCGSGLKYKYCCGQG